MRRLRMTAAGCVLLGSLAMAGAAGEVRIPADPSVPGGPEQAGTLTLPKGPGPHPAVVLVSPAGDHPRDELRSGGEHWADLARHLADHGIASLRVDQRGVGGSRSDAWPEPDRSRTCEDLAVDLAAQHRFLRERTEIDGERIGILAHGDGCVPAAIFAAQRGGLAFAGLLSPPGLRGLDNVVAGQLARVPQEAVSGERRSELEAALRAGLARLVDGAPREDVVRALEPGLAILGVPAEQRAAAAGGLHDQLADDWTRHFLRFDPVPSYAGMGAPTLVVFANSDERYPSAPNREAVEKAFAVEPGGRTRPAATVRSFDETGHFLEAADRPGFLDPRVVEAVLEFFNSLLGK